MHARAADHGAGTDSRDRAFPGARPIGADDRRPLAFAEEDQAVEVEAAFDLEPDVAAVDRVLAARRPVVAEAALRARSPRRGCGCGAGREHEGKEPGAAHTHRSMRQRLRQG